MYEASLFPGNQHQLDLERVSLVFVNLHQLWIRSAVSRSQLEEILFPNIFSHIDSRGQPDKSSKKI